MSTWLLVLVKVPGEPSVGKLALLDRVVRNNVGATMVRTAMAADAAKLPSAVEMLGAYEARADHESREPGDGG